MATILMPLSSRDFDPTETGVPWRVMRRRGHRVVFATPDGNPGQADERMVSGQGLGLLAPLLKADRNGRAAYAEMTESEAFRQPVAYDAIGGMAFDALMLPGGHAAGMRAYLESTAVQNMVVEFFEAEKPVGAICHGVLVAARARAASGRSVLYGRKTTALTKLQELSAWALTRWYLGSYYRTYPTPVEAEVRAALARPEDFIAGPMSLTRDTPENPAAGFVVVDGAYVSARWPGDAHRFAETFCDLIEQRPHHDKPGARA
jgi:protease I